MKYIMELYQVRVNYDTGIENTDILFRPYDMIKDKTAIKASRYDKVNTMEVEAGNVMDAMEIMYSIFNRGEGYRHRSMTTSDVVGVHFDNGIVYFYCDFVGFVKLDSF